MPAVSVTTVNKIRRACEAAKDVADAAALRGELNNLPRKGVAQVGKAARSLLNALGHMIHGDERLMAVLSEWAVQSPPGKWEANAEAISGPLVNLDDATEAASE
jgi:hypothetical protein